MEDLRNLLTTEDFRKIEEYYHKYALVKEDIENDKVVDMSNYLIPTRDFLCHWAYSKNKLYHFLGDNFIVKIPISQELSNSTLEQRYSQFKRTNDDYNYLVGEINRALRVKLNYDTCSFYAIIDALYALEAIESNLLLDEVYISLQEEKKPLKISKGTKWIKAMNKVCSYLGLFENEVNKSKFEKMRIAHSMISNDRKIGGNLCISIHPLDFMTMSDNNSDWTSCMSWRNDGCYKTGSYEMMNSNNVVCCYIESSRGMGFEKNTVGDFWNNKKWRVLAYVNKDIIMTGKAYPYENQELCKKILEVLRGYAAEMPEHWTYKYGPELYKDMEGLEDGYELEECLCDPKKKVIMFESNVMYNDMVNTYDYPYLAIRNPISHSRKIKVSGKIDCVCCGHNLLEDNTEYDDEYNDRFINTNRFYCSSCAENFQCEDCRNFSTELHSISVIDDYGEEIIENLCPECIKNYIRECPDCGENFRIGNSVDGVWTSVNAYDDIFLIEQDEEHPIDIKHLAVQDFYLAKETEDKHNSNIGIHYLCMCANCSRNIPTNYVSIRYGAQPSLIPEKQFQILESSNIGDFSKYFFENLNPATVD